MESLTLNQVNYYHYYHCFYCFIYLYSIQNKSYATQVESEIADDAMKKSEIDVEGWIKKHYTPYEGDATFLEGPTEKTKKLFAKAEQYLAKERENGGLYDVDTSYSFNYHFS
ncbi:PFL-domain-containing protein [Piromyces finnis]|uniref:PFL-domain-containing protein n=1 Tax=Piromyces finnis TaxID=1754191 RepID=A0A1Y1UJ07_9FUNG|nr:PFL-domain-containing protein [Piromyces finnis]|eukprot:ORX37466.1 PFL-domain-containing protein [Piromyces finnis]